MPNKQQPSEQHNLVAWWRVLVATYETDAARAGREGRFKDERHHRAMAAWARAQMVEAIAQALRDA